jgi:hypothetical protein
MDKLLKALEREATELRSAEFVVGGEIQKVYYRIMSGDDHARALELSKKTKTVKETDGSETELSYYDDDLLRCYIIYFQLLNENGERVFTNLTDIDWIKKNITYETSSYLAAVMGLKSVSDIITEQQELLKKTNGSRQKHS